MRQNKGLEHFTDPVGSENALGWRDFAFAGFLTLIAIPLTFSIANGLAFGIVSYALLKLARGQARVGDWMLYLLAALFIAGFVQLAAG